MKLYSGKVNELASFYRAFKNTRREMGVSVLVLLLITFTLSIIFYLVEHIAQPDVFDSWWSSVVWAYSRYIEGGDGVFDGGPVTVVGRTIAFLLGLIGIAIVAIPAGLIGSGFIDAIAEEKREKEIDGYKEKMELSFREGLNVSLREYLVEEPGLCPVAKGKSGFYIPSFVPLTKLQVRYGMSVNDVYDTAAKYPQFRIANLAAMHSDEDNPDDRLVVTHQYINRPYGCFIDRHSKITIVSPSSVLETLTGWFAHYLAVAGGFNFISKEIDPNIGDFDSFAAMTPGVRVDGYSYNELLQDKSKNADKLKLYDKKVTNRKCFLDDLNSVCRGEGSWMIFINAALMNKSNKDEFHFASSRANGNNPTVLESCAGTYQALFESFAEMVKNDFDYSAVQSSRYPHPLGFPTYELQKAYPDAVFNAFSIKVGAPAILDNRKMILIYKMARTINESLGGNGMTEYDAQYLSVRHFGLREYNPIND